MTDSVPDRPRPLDGSMPTVLLGDVTASSVTAWSVLGELRPLPAPTGGDASRQLWRTPAPAPPPAVESTVERGPEQRPEARQPQLRPRPPESREQGQQREKRAQRDRQVVAQRARDEDTRLRQVRPGQSPGQSPGQRPGQRAGQSPGQRPGQRPGQSPGQRRAGQAPARQAQSTVAWTAQPTARGAPQRSTSSGPGGRVGPPARPGPRPRSERSRVSPVRIVGLVVVVIVLAGRCLNGLT